MKKYLTTLSIALIAALALTWGISRLYAQGGIGLEEQVETGPLLTKAGNGDLGNSFVIPSFQLSPKNLASGSLGTTPTNWFNVARTVTFRVFGTSIFNNIVAYQDTLIHRLTVGSSSQGPSDIPLRVDGYIKIESLADPNADPYVPACVNDFGTIERCRPGEDPEDPDPINGVCGAAHGGSFTNPPTEGLCAITGTTPTVTTSGNTYNWQCTGQYGGANASCSATKITTTYHWDWSAWGSCTGSVGSCSGTWTSYGACDPQKHVAGSYWHNPYTGETEMPGPYEGESCIVVPQNLCDSTHPDYQNTGWLYHPCNRWDPDYAWPSQSCNGLSEQVCGIRQGCTWNVTGGTQTRTAICKDNQGNTVPDNLCPQPKPQPQTQSC